MKLTFIILFLVGYLSSHSQKQLDIAQINQLAAQLDSFHLGMYTDGSKAYFYDSVDKCSNFLIDTANGNKRLCVCYQRTWISDSMYLIRFYFLDNTLVKAVVYHVENSESEHKK